MFYHSFFGFYIAFSLNLLLLNLILLLVVTYYMMCICTEILSWVMTVVVMMMMCYVAGGVDLKFPHHDNELAQAEAHFNNDHWVSVSTGLSCCCHYHWLPKVLPSLQISTCYWLSVFSIVVTCRTWRSDIYSVLIIVMYAFSLSQIVIINIYQQFLYLRVEWNDMVVCCGLVTFKKPEKCFLSLVWCWNIMRVVFQNIIS